MKTSADLNESWEENALPSLPRKPKKRFPIPSSYRLAAAVQERVVNICFELLARIPKGWSISRRLFGFPSTFLVLVEPAERQESKHTDACVREAGDSGYAVTKHVSSTEDVSAIILSDLIAHHVMAVNSLRTALLSEITTPSISGIDCIDSCVADAVKTEKSARQSIIAYEPFDEAEMSAKVLYLMALVLSEGVPLVQDDYDEMSRLNSKVH